MKKKDHARERESQKLNVPAAVRVLGACGLAASALSSAAGFFAMPSLLGVAGVVMTAANLYALTTGAVAQETQALQETQDPVGKHANGGTPNE